MKNTVLFLLLFINISYSQETEKFKSTWGGSENVASIGQHEVDNSRGYRRETKIKTGEWEHYHKNGNLDWVGSYIKNKRVGVWKFYYPKSGNLWAKKNYDNDKLEGKSIEYHINGQVSIESSYANGELVGSQTKYYENGQIKSKMTFDNGNFVSLTEAYSEDGQLEDIDNVRMKKLYGKVDGDYRLIDLLKAYILLGDMRIQEGKEIINKINSLEDSPVNNKRYDELTASLEEKYKSALSHFEEVYKHDPSDDLKSKIKSTKEKLLSWKLKK
ncbi:hypothetical protein Q4Q34_06200 [Flavivirga abyssicola]|uniref:toxin-antitoxin system YwqK family antitoxin n=1 Tax=Flavivirga abyssicola TaxID=3063533 RepID=UPI0026DF6055|nr:hypothetical protein [Flavivirga sp. MEBiC07777]WVK14620.1 hypothetical protein Q4Q34_06200 [Flavivirga sp. MEBiC07777]